MLNQFSRTELLLGKAAMDRLSTSRIAVFGIGGVGGYTVEALVRSGIGAVDLIDDDKICLTNIVLPEQKENAHSADRCPAATHSFRLLLD